MSFGDELQDLAFAPRQLVRRLVNSNASTIVRHNDAGDFRAQINFTLDNRIQGIK